MPRQRGGITKTQRILAIYHLFRYCSEVSMAEMKSMLSGCNKTFSRDIALLKKAGVGIRYSVKRQAYVTVRCDGVPNLPEGKADKRFLEKIIRLITVMDEIPMEDCDIWYMENIPGAAKRTMQRDFAILNSIGYEIKYERSEFNYHDAGSDLPHGHYYCDSPNGAYSLEIS